MTLLARVVVFSFPRPPPSLRVTVRMIFVSMSWGVFIIWRVQPWHIIRSARKREGNKQKPSSPSPAKHNLFSNKTPVTEVLIISSHKHRCIYFFLNRCSGGLVSLLLAQTTITTSSACAILLDVRKRTLLLAFHDRSCQPNLHSFSQLRHAVVISEAPRG